MNVTLPEIDRLKLTSTESEKSVTILGSTGSIGCNTLDLISRNKEKFSVKALTANKNVSKLAKQAIAFDAELAVIAEEELLDALKEALSGTKIKAAAGEIGLEEASAMDAEWVMSSIVGAAGLKPTLSAIMRGATIALANKE